MYLASRGPKIVRWCEQEFIGASEVPESRRFGIKESRVRPTTHTCEFLVTSHLHHCSPQAHNLNNLNNSTTRLTGGTRLVVAAAHSLLCLYTQVDVSFRAPLSFPTVKLHCKRSQTIPQNTSTQGVTPSQAKEHTSRRNHVRSTLGR